MLPEPSTAPVLSGERMETLDAVRGVAVLGILLVNVVAFSGYAFMTPAQRAAVPMSRLDGPVFFLMALVIEAKFYSLFSFLFGVGFAVFVQRASGRGADAVRLFKRRLVGLLLIGLVHTLFIWMGDILLIYALIGFALIPFLRRDDRSLLRWAVAMLASPIVIYLMLAVAVSFVPTPAGPGDGSLPPFLQAATDKFAYGSYLETVEGNVVFTLAQLVRRFILMFYPRVFGMFLLGLYVGRHRMFANPDAHRRLITNMFVAGLTVGLPFAALGAALETDVPVIGLRGFIETTAKTIAAPVLAIAYAAGLVLLFQRSRRLAGALAPVGRMALTNYLMHSVVGVFIFYGIGLGYFRQLSLSIAVAGAFGLFLVQMLISRVWLTHANFGPAEWLWRTFTYRRSFPLLRTSKT